MRYIIAMLVSWCSCVPNALAWCSWKDAECLAPFVLPGYTRDVDPRFPSIREWSASSGITYGYDNRIITRVRFDQESVDILRSNGDFGLEIELSLKGSNRNIPVDRIETTFPLNAQAGRDTTVLDSWTNPDATNVAVHILNPSVIEPGVDYFVYFIFKDPLPIDGVLVSTVNLQITLDFGTAQNYSPSLVYFLAHYILSAEYSSFFDQFQYSALETDYHEPFTAYPTGTTSGFSGVCWTSKVDSEACWINQCIGSVEEKDSIWSSLALGILGVTNARAEIVGCASGSGTVAPIRTGSGSGGDSPPAPLPNLQIEEVTVHIYPEGSDTRLAEGTTLMRVGQTYQVNVWPVSREENCQNGNATGNPGFEVKTDIFYKIALKESDGEWRLLQRSATHCANMGKDDSKKETAFFTVPPEAAGRRLYLKAEVDATGDIRETDEGDNWSDVEWYPIQGSCNLVVSSVRLTGQRISLKQGEPYGFAVTVLNVEPDACPSDTRTSYLYKKPGDAEWRYADGDDTPASKLLPNQPNEEWMTTDALVADVPGTYRGRACADTNLGNTETNEGDNCTEFPFEVPSSPLPIMTVPEPQAGAVWRCGSSGEYQYIRWNGVTFAQSPTVEIWYSLDDGMSWRSIDSSVSNDGKYRWYMCKSPIGKDSAYGRVKVAARANGQTISGISGRFFIDYARGCK